MSGTEPVEIPVPAAVADLRLLPRVGYDDAFAVETASDHGPEWWMRTFIEGAPRWFQVPWLGMGKAVLGVRIGPLSGSPGHVLGWEVLDAGPDAFAIGLDSPRGLAARLITLTPPGRAIVATQIGLDSRYARAVWPAVRTGHRFFAPYLLGRAAARA